jgi:hypothetical protein
MFCVMLRCVIWDAWLDINVSEPPATLDFKVTLKMEAASFFQMVYFNHLYRVTS